MKHNEFLDTYNGKISDYDFIQKNEVERHRNPRRFEVIYLFINRPLSKIPSSMSIFAPPTHLRRE